MPAHSSATTGTATSADARERTAHSPGASGEHPAAGATGYSEGRASVQPPAPPTYQVRPGDSLWSIAETELGNGNLWVALWRANRAKIHNKNAIPVGIVLQIPEALRARGRTENTPAESAAPAAERTVVVRSGDTLGKLAARELGDAGKWADIWAWNRDQITNPNRIQVGMELRLTAGGPSALLPTPAPAPATPSAASPAPTGPAPDARGDASMAPDGPLATGNTPLEKLLANLWNSKGGFIAQEAGRLGIETGVAAACLHVESGGSGFRNGAMVIRFESHIFSDLAGTWVPARHSGDQADEWHAFERAKAIDPGAAYESISMGAAQIMGFNAERIGYGSAKDMFDDFSASERAQAKGFFEFVRTSRGLTRAAQAKDWPTFARLYNGAGYARNAYDSKLAAAYGAFARVMSRMAAATT